MAKTVTVWVRLNQNFDASVALNDEPQGVIPLVLRMRGDSAAQDEDFVFPYNPREINFGQLADETAQIARPATTPILAFKSHRLMTVDFTALISRPGDGLIESIDKELQVLRKFASSSDKVFELVNYDILTNTPFKYRNMSTEQNNGLFFSITEMSINVTRRNRLNQITQANVSISLIENRNPRMNIAFITPLAPIKPPDPCKQKKYRKTYPNRCKPKKVDQTPKAPLLSEQLQLTGSAALNPTQNCFQLDNQWICPPFG